MDGRVQSPTMSTPILMTTICVSIVFLIAFIFLMTAMVMALMVVTALMMILLVVRRGLLGPELFDGTAQRRMPPGLVGSTPFEDVVGRSVAFQVP